MKRERERERNETFELAKKTTTKKRKNERTFFSFTFSFFVLLSSLFFFLLLSPTLEDEKCVRSRPSCSCWRSSPVLTRRRTFRRPRERSRRRPARCSSLARLVRFSRGHRSIDGSENDLEFFFLSPSAHLPLPPSLLLLNTMPSLSSPCLPSWDVTPP